MSWLLICEYYKLSNSFVIITTVVFVQKELQKYNFYP